MYCPCRDEGSTPTINSLDDQGKEKVEEQLDSVCDNKTLPLSNDDQLSYAESPVQNVSLMDDGNNSRDKVDLETTEDDLMQLGFECLSCETPLNGDTPLNAKVTIKQQNAKKIEKQSKIATTTLMIGDCFSRSCKENVGIYKARGKTPRDQRKLRKMQLMVEDKSENILKRYSLAGQINYSKSMVSNDVKLPPIPKSPAKAKRHVTPGFQIPNTVMSSAMDTYSSKQTIRKGRPSKPSQLVKTNFVLGNNNEKANNVAFLQLSPFSGSAMSYSSAMSKNLTISMPDRNASIGERKSQLVPFRHVSKTLSPSSSREGFPSLVPNVAENLGEMKEDQVDVVFDNIALRRRRIQKHATLIEIDDHDKFDDSHLVKFDIDEKMKGLVHKLRGYYTLCLHMHYNCCDIRIGGVIDTLDNLTDEIRDEYEDFLTQVDEITYYQLCQVSISVSHGAYEWHKQPS